MKSNRIRRNVLPLGMAGIMAVAIATGAGFSPSAVVAKPAPDKVAAEAQKALSSGQVDKAIELAEALVAANPREASYRALLGQAYLRAGRFESSAQALNDAMKLGDNSSRTALSLALANVGQGKNREAVAILDDWRDAIPAADLGLAYALAGETNRGVAILSDALRAGDNTPKLRQNLAYAFALDGRWREARLMVSQDVPAGQVDARLSDWASKAKPEDGRVRVASLIGAPNRQDSGMPTALALNASAEQQQLAAETAAQRDPAPALAANGELPAATRIRPNWPSTARLTLLHRLLRFRPRRRLPATVRRALPPALAVTLKPPPLWPRRRCLLRQWPRLRRPRLRWSRPPRSRLQPYLSPRPTVRDCARAAMPRRFWARDRAMRFSLAPSAANRVRAAPGVTMPSATPSCATSG